MAEDLATDGAAVASAVSCSPNPQLRLGPSTWKDLCAWPFDFLRSLQDHGYMHNMLRNANLGVNLLTDWSGMGVPEMALDMISKSLKDGWRLEAEHGIRHRSVRVADRDSYCREVLATHSPAHIFADIQERVGADILEKLQGLTNAAQEKVRSSMAQCGQKVNAEARDLFGEQLFYDMCNVLQEYDFTKVTAHCSVHNKHCPIWGTTSDKLDGGRIGVVIGNECLDWTSFGNQMQLVGHGLMVLLIWSFEMLALQPDWIVQECTPRFKPFVFEHIFVRLSGGLYTMLVRCFSPVDLGFPASWPRQYIILTRAQRLKVLVPFADPMVEQIFFRRRQANASLFFTDLGGPMERQAFKRQLMKERGMVFNDKKKHIASKTLSLLPSAKQVHFKGYKKLAETRGRTEGVVDVSQTAGYRSNISEVVPTLLRGSVLVDIRTGGVMLPSVRFDVMAIPVHRANETLYKPPIVDLLPKMDTRQMQKLTGNAMHAAAVGMCLLYTLACCEYISGV